jgi:DNA-binding NarL/FixJ family response regulator
METSSIQVNVDNGNENAVGTACTVIIFGHNHLFDSLLKNYLEQHSNIDVLIVGGMGDDFCRISSLDDDRCVIKLVNACGKSWTELSTALDNPLGKLRPTAKVVLFNVEPDSDLQSLALQLGVRGLIYHNDSPEMALRAIQSVAGGELWAPRRALEQCIMETSGVASLHGLSSVAKELLSQRETSVLSLITAGYGNKAIAQELFISENTVKTHINNIFRKIGVSSRFQAALWVAKKINENS